MNNAVGSPEERRPRLLVGPCVLPPPPGRRPGVPRHRRPSAPKSSGTAGDTACRSAWRAGLESAVGPRGSRPPPGPCPSPPRQPKPPTQVSGWSLALFRHPSFRDQLYRL